MKIYYITTKGDSEDLSVEQFIGVAAYYKGLWQLLRDNDWSEQDIERATQGDDLEAIVTEWASEHHPEWDLHVGCNDVQLDLQYLAEDTDKGHRVRVFTDDAELQKALRDLMVESFANVKPDEVSEVEMRGWTAFQAGEYSEAFSEWCAVQSQSINYYHYGDVEWPEQPA